MKRYMELIIAILEYAEREGNGKLLSQPEIAGYTPEQINYHIQLCGEAGYLEAEGTEKVGGLQDSLSGV